jgi:hypothetical protein
MPFILYNKVKLYYFRNFHYHYRLLARAHCNPSYSPRPCPEVITTVITPGYTCPEVITMTYHCDNLRLCYPQDITVTCHGDNPRVHMPWGYHQDTITVIPPGYTCPEVITMTCHRDNLRIGYPQGITVTCHGDTLKVETTLRVSPGHCFGRRCIQYTL